MLQLGGLYSYKCTADQTFAGTTAKVREGLAFFCPANHMEAGPEGNDFDLKVIGRRYQQDGSSDLVPWIASGTAQLDGKIFLIQYKTSDDITDEFSVHVKEGTPPQMPGSFSGRFEQVVDGIVYTGGLEYTKLEVSQLVEAALARLGANADQIRDLSSQASYVDFASAVVKRFLESNRPAPTDTDLLVDLVTRQGTFYVTGQLNEKAESFPAWANLFTLPASGEPCIIR